MGPKTLILLIKAPKIDPGTWAHESQASVLTSLQTLKSLKESDGRLWTIPNITKHIDAEFAELQPREREDFLLNA